MSESEWIGVPAEDVCMLGMFTRPPVFIFFPRSRLDRSLFVGRAAVCLDCRFPERLLGGCETFE